MSVTKARTLSQACIGMGTLGLACLAIAAAYARLGATILSFNSVPAILAALILAVAIVLAYRFPIHVQHKTTMQVTSVPVYLLAALLPPPLAATAVGVGILTGELNARCRCPNPLSHVVTHAARLALIALGGSLLAHVQLPIGNTMLRELPLVGTGVVLWAGDFLTILLVLAPISGQPAARLLPTLVRHSGIQEGAQYFVGLLGALAAMEQIWALTLLALPTLLLYRGLNRGMDKSTRQTLEGVADAVDMRNSWTVGYSHRVAKLTAGILREMRLRGPETPLIVFAARVHDIGKVSMPDRLMNKDAVLAPEEQAIMEAHAVHGAELLMRYPDLAQVAEIIRHHHERWDGQGYPARLAGTDIPFGARAIAVASSFAAMTADRPYRRALSADAAAAILRDGRGQQWDPEIVDSFLRSIADQLTGSGVPRLQVVGGFIDLGVQGVS